MPSVHALFNRETLNAVLPHLGPRHLYHEFVENEAVHTLVKRINITIPFRGGDPALRAASLQDPWKDSGKYAAGWVGFAFGLLAFTLAARLYHMWTDRIRRALHKEREEAAIPSYESSPDDYEMKDLEINGSVKNLFPQSRHAAPESGIESSLSMPVIDKLLASIRWLFYRPIPSIRITKKLAIVSPSAGVAFVVLLSLAFAILFSFIPQPLFHQTIRFGSPPLAIRAGMISVSMIPWIVALSMKANLVSLITGLGHERLNALHRWGGYICLILALIHTIPFYITPVWNDGALPLFMKIYQGQSYIYGTGIAALAPLAFLCLHSLPFLRRWMYELFITLHTPVAIVFIGMMIWHCQNFLTSWQYLFATIGIWGVSLLYRLFFLNWTNFRRLSFFCGEECSIVMLPENAIKVTVPTQMRWRPGQFVYLRIPGISIFENHPFTVASLNSEDFPSDYGAQYRDMILVFRPFGGFTRKVMRAAAENGPYHTYRAFLDGPYGGMRRELASFDTVVLVAGGSGITSIVSHLLLLIKKMRDGSAVVRNVHVIWALKRPDTAEWFKEELRICRQYAPPDSVHCQFFITAAKRMPRADLLQSPPPGTGTFGPEAAAAKPRPTSFVLHERLNDAFQGIAEKRSSALVREAAGDDPDLKKTLQREEEDAITALPQKTAPAAPGPVHLSPATANQPVPYFPPPPTAPTVDTAKANAKGGGGRAKRPRPTSMKIEIPNTEQSSGFDFGFPATPTALQKNLMRFAFMPGVARGKKGWHTEYGRPDLPYMLKGLRGEFGRRTCVFVCGPPSMREDVQSCVASMQADVWSGREGRGRVDEIFLHTENYAI